MLYNQTKMLKNYLKQLFFTTCFALLAACGSDHRNGSYTIAYDPAWFGTELLGQQNNVTGFSRDLLKEIGKLEKIKLSFLAMSWDTLIPNLKSKQYDAILSSLYPYLFNQTYFEFSAPYLPTGPVLVLPSNSNVMSIADLSGAEIAVLPDIVGAIYLEKNSEILIRNYDSIPDALNDIIAGTIQGAVVDILIASAYCNNIYHGSLKVVGPPMNDTGMRLIALEQTPPIGLIKAFDDGLVKLKKNGTYHKLLEKWTLGQ
jgi:polar amino acid transport system substrate-binding protein